MPKATVGFRFEWKVLSWSQRLSGTLTGSPHYPFLILLTSKGRVRQVLVGEEEEGRADGEWERLRETSPAWFMHDPFEGPVYTYISWRGLARETLERLVGEPFDANDLPPQFPTEWGVMF